MTRIGIDTGGTFTDIVIVDDDGRITTWKEPSTPDDPARAILDGLSRATVTLSGSEVIHGSTVATNALLTGGTATIAFVTNNGFEDLLEIGRQARPDLYNLNVKRPLPLAERHLRFGIAGRVLHDGSTHEPVNPSEVGRLAADLKSAGVESVALCLLHSYADNSHEESVARLLSQAGLLVSVSSRLVNEYREYERASTCAVNAAVGPVVSRYLDRLEAGLGGHRLKNLRVMGSNGGALSPAVAGQQAVRTVLSGPAAGVRAALHVGRAISVTRLISFDMGGTSTDVCLIDGDVRTTGEAIVAGHPARIPTIDIHTVGAGGGSIAWRDAGGALRVGPASAGAVPGPACYGGGGPPTVTDANLVLGRIIPERFLDGRMALDTSAAFHAIGELADSLGLSAQEAAEGIVHVAEVTMTRAVRVISLNRGYEPADFALLAFGGAGGLHAAALAASLGIHQVIIPTDPGLFSAFGMTVADVMKDRAASLLMDADSATRVVMESRFAEIEALCVKDLRDDGVAPGDIRCTRSVDARYKGQSYEINIAWSEKWLDAFHEAHGVLYGYLRSGQPVELVTLRVRGLSHVHTSGGNRPMPRDVPTHAPVPRAHRIIHEQRDLTAHLYERERLDRDTVVTGPSLILESGATTYVPPGWQACTDPSGHIHMRAHH